MYEHTEPKLPISEHLGRRPIIVHNSVAFLRNVNECTYINNPRLTEPVFVTQLQKEVVATPLTFSK